VARELDRQGIGAGEGPIHRALGEEAHRSGAGKVSLHLVREELAAEKRRRRARTREEIERVRESHDVLARDALWCRDGTHLGRLTDGSEVSAEVIEDRGSLSTAGLAVGGPASAESTDALLEETAAERGGWPLAIQEDNAGIYRARDDAMERRRVVVLASRVHRPTDNPAIEHRNRELQEESGLGKGVVLADADEAGERIEPARRRLDDRRRATRGWMTAAQLDRFLPRADSLVDRDEFYRTACVAMREAEQGLVDRDERCLARQKAFWETMRRFGLARTCVGPRPRVRPAPTPCTAARDRVE
jgi:hypothetical protein